MNTYIYKGGILARFRSSQRLLVLEEEGQNQGLRLSWPLKFDNEWLCYHYQQETLSAPQSRHLYIEKER